MPIACPEFTAVVGSVTLCRCPSMAPPPMTVCDRVFVLIHKMDLICEHKRDEVVEIRRSMISMATKNRGMKCTFFQTSIWDETLYKVGREDSG